MMGRPPSSPMGREKMKNPLLLLLINSLHHKCPFPETSVQLPSSSPTPPPPPPPPGCCSLRQQKEKISEILPTSTKSNQFRKTLLRNFVVRAERRQKPARVASYAVATVAEIIFLRVSHETNLHPHPHPQPSIHPSIRTKSLQIRSSGYTRF